MATKTLPKIGKIITKRKLMSLYGDYAMSVLGEYVSQLNTKRGEIRKYKVIKQLPDVAEFKNLLDLRYTSTVEGLISDAYSEFTSLGDELRGWYDNLPESFQGGDKGECLDQAASSLEGISEPTVQDRLSPTLRRHITECTLRRCCRQAKHCERRTRKAIPGRRRG